MCKGLDSKGQQNCLMQGAAEKSKPAQELDAPLIHDTCLLLKCVIVDSETPAMLADVAAFRWKLWPLKR